MKHELPCPSSNPTDNKIVDKLVAIYDKHNLILRSTHAGVAYGCRCDICTFLLEEGVLAERSKSRA